MHMGDTGKRYTAEQIVNKLREAEVELAKGLTIVSVAKKLGITDQTYYRWRREYGDLRGAGGGDDHGSELLADLGNGQVGLEPLGRRVQEPEGLKPLNQGVD